MVACVSPLPHIAPKRPKHVIYRICVRSFPWLTLPSLHLWNQESASSQNISVASDEVACLNAERKSTQ